MGLAALKSLLRAPLRHHSLPPFGGNGRDRAPRGECRAIK
jgi:hypothetical protein